MSVCERVRQHRRRRRLGIEWIPLEVDARSIAAMIADGRLTPDEALQPDTVARALSRVLFEATALKKM